MSDISDLIAPCRAVLRLAETMTSASNDEMTRHAREMVENNYQSAITERGRWQTAREALEEVIKPFLSDGKFDLVIGLQDERIAAWHACAAPYQEVLETETSRAS